MFVLSCLLSSSEQRSEIPVYWGSCATVSDCINSLGLVFLWISWGRSSKLSSVSLLPLSLSLCVYECVYLSVCTWVCECVNMCVCARERGREREGKREGEGAGEGESGSEIVLYLTFGKRSPHWN